MTTTKRRLWVPKVETFLGDNCAPGAPRESAVGGYSQEGTEQMRWPAGHGVYTGSLWVLAVHIPTFL